MLVDTATEIKNDSADTREKLKLIAKNFWRLLQKNKQYRELPKIMTSLCEMSAMKRGKTTVKVFSSNFEADFDSIFQKRIEKIVKKEIIFEKITKSVNDGPVFVYEDKIIDLSSRNLISKLATKLKESIS